MRLKYLVYYADETILVGFTLEDWLKMPDEGILVISEIFDRTYGHPKKYAGERHAYMDYYWMDENGDIDCGTAKNVPDKVYIKRGKYVNSELWDKIYNLACIDEEIE